MEVDDRVFFQVYGLDTVYKLKLSPRSAFRHLFAHVPLDRGTGHPDDARFLWFDVALRPDLTPADYGMAPGEHSAHVIRVEYSDVPTTIVVGGERSTSAASDASDTPAPAAHGAKHAQSARNISYFRRDPQADHVRSTTPLRANTASLLQPARTSTTLDSSAYSGSKARMVVPSYPPSEANSEVASTEPSRHRATRHHDVSTAHRVHSHPAEAHNDLNGAPVIHITEPSVSVTSRQAHHRLALASPAKDDPSLETAACDEVPRSTATVIGPQWRPLAQPELRRADVEEQSQSALLPAVHTAGDTRTQQPVFPSEQAPTGATAKPRSRRASDAASAAPFDTAAVVTKSTPAAAAQGEEDDAAEITTLRRQLQAKDRRASQLSDELNQARATAAVTASDRNSDSADMHSLRAQVDHLKKQNDKLRSQVRELEIGQIEAVRAATVEAEERHALEVKELRRRLGSIDDGRTQLDRRTNELEALRREHAELKAFCETQTAEFNRVQQELAETKGEYEDAMAEMRQAIESLNHQNEALLSESSVASQNAIRGHGEMKMVKERLEAESRVAAEVPSLRSRIDALEEEVAAAVAAERARHESDLSKWQKTATDLNTTVQALRSEVAVANDAVARANRENESLKRIARDAEYAADEAIQQAESSKRKAADDLTRLSSVKAEVELSLLECNNVIIASQKEVARLRHQVLELQQSRIADGVRESTSFHMGSRTNSRTNAAAAANADPQSLHLVGVPSFVTVDSFSDSIAPAQHPASARGQPTVAAGTGPARGPIDGPAMSRSGSAAVLVAIGPASGPHQPASRSASSTQHTAGLVDPSVPSATVPGLTPRASRARLPGQPPAQTPLQLQHHH
jgi:uncharacterized protein YukE